MENQTQVGNKILSWFAKQVGMSRDGLIGFAGHCLAALLILVIGFRVIKYLIKMVEKLLSRANVDDTLHSFLISFMRLGLQILVIFMAMNQIGVATSSIVAIIGSAGLALGLSLQGSLSNIAGGVVLMMIKPFQVGDYIIDESSGKEGNVQAIGMMYTKLLSVDNRAIMIPNGGLANACITNVTNQDIRQVQIYVGVGYQSDIKEVRKVLTDILDAEKKSLSDEPYKIYVNDFKDSSIEMGIRFWVKTEEYWEVKWRVMETIKEKFDEHAIEIPYNKLDVNITNQM